MHFRFWMLQIFFLMGDKIRILSSVPSPLGGDLQGFVRLLHLAMKSKGTNFCTVGSHSLERCAARSQLSGTKPSRPKRRKNVLREVKSSDGNLFLIRLPRGSRNQKMLHFRVKGPSYWPHQENTLGSGSRGAGNSLAWTPRMSAQPNDQQQRCAAISSSASNDTMNPQSAFLYASRRNRFRERDWFD